MSRNDKLDVIKASKATKATKFNVKIKRIYIIA